jgi:hypothetical protein
MTDDERDERDERILQAIEAAMEARGKERRSLPVTGSPPSMLLKFGVVVGHPYHVAILARARCARLGCGCGGVVAVWMGMN